MNYPAVLVLLQEQGDRSLKDHTKDFVFLANLTHYPDSCLCSFYQAGLNTATRAGTPPRSPRSEHLLCLGPLDPRCCPGSSALRLRLRLLHHLLRRHWLAPWSRQPLLHHRSSLRRLHRGPQLWLWPESCLAPPAPSPSWLLPSSDLPPGSSCFLPGSFLHRLHPGPC